VRRQLFFLLASPRSYKVEQLADFLQAEAEALAAQDQLQPPAVAPGEQAFLPVADREQQFLGLVKPQVRGVTSKASHISRIVISALAPADARGNTPRRSRAAREPPP
jgi:hypothetical protein